MKDIRNKILNLSEITFRTLHEAEDSILEKLISIKKISKNKKNIDLTVRDLSIIEKYNIIDLVMSFAKEKIKEIYKYCNTSNCIYVLPSNEKLTKYIDEFLDDCTKNTSPNKSIGPNIIVELLKAYDFSCFTIEKIEVLLNDNIQDNVLDQNKEVEVKTIVNSIIFKLDRIAEDLVIVVNDDSSYTENYSFTSEIGYLEITKKISKIIQEKYEQIANEKIDQVERAFAMLTSSR